MPQSRSLDDTPWEVLAAFLAGELSNEDQLRVRQWLAEDPRREELLAVLKQGWQASAENRRRYDAEYALQRIKVRARTPASVPAPRREWSQVVRPRWVTAASRVLMAASLAALAVGGWWITVGREQRSSSSGVHATPLPEYRTVGGQRLAFKLPDGSSVILGPASALRVDAAYGRGARVVELEGEAYFEVIHETERPFSVLTRHTLVRDLGTRFVVRAYPEDGITDVVVGEGLVALGKPGASGAMGALSSDSLLLTPGQRGRLTAAETLEFTAQVHLGDYLAWTQGRLVFHDTPLPEALRRIGRWYDVRIQWSDTGLAGRTLTASFRDESASEVVRLIAASFDLRIERDGHDFTLRSPAD